MKHDKIKEALKQFFKNDYYLIDNNLHEQTLTHMLGIYLGQIFANYNVDCEWNKNLQGPKVIDLQVLMESISRYIKNISQRTSSEIAKTYKSGVIERLDKILDSSFRDYVVDSNKDRYLLIAFDETLKMITTGGKNMIKSIRPDIIVHHRGTNDNLIAFEVKKKQSNKRYNLLKLFDLTKLTALTQQLGYKSAYYIEFNDLKWSEIVINQSKFVKTHYIAPNGNCNVYEVTFK